MTTLEEVRHCLTPAFGPACTRCSLSRSRYQVVFGSGNPEAELMLVGEAPGKQEDAHGEPFIGAAGDLLTRLLTKAGIDRSEVYITNTVKCRPPRNREPELHEIRACRPFLLDQLRAIRPRVVVTIGRVATHTLLHTSSALSSVRGVIHTWRGCRVIPTYHPAYLLRQGAWSSSHDAVVEDFQRAVKQTKQTSEWWMLS